MSKLIIKRVSEWKNKMRDIRIYLDGNKIGTIRNGEIKGFEIEPGQHSLKAKIDRCGSKTITIDLTENGTQKVELSGFKLGKWLMPITLLIIAAYFGLEQLWNIDRQYIMILIIPVFAYFIYPLTFGRNKYLRLRNI